MATRLQRLRRGGVSETFAFAGPAFRRAAPWLLAGVAFLGLLARAYPALRYAVWGSDSGEYYILTQRLVDAGRISFEYSGWGLAYPYFPGMFVLSGAVHAVLGVDVLRAVLWTTPLLAASLSVLVGLLGYRITGDPRVAVLGGAFVAVSATVVITTSHAMPGTLGQVFLLGALCLVPDAYKAPRLHAPLLALLAAAMLFAHHLTTYFAIGIVAMVAFYREFTQRQSDVARLRVEVPFAGGLLLLAALWWLVVATPFREEIVGDALPFPPWLTAILSVLALASLPAIVVYRRRRWPDAHLVPRYPAFPRQWATSLAMALGIWLLILFVTAVSVPGSSIRVGRLALVYVVPVLVFVAFVPLGASVIRFYRQGALAIGATYAILASLAFAIVTNSRVLFPFRHVDYLMMALAPVGAIGMLVAYDQTLASRIPVERPRARAWLIGAMVALVVLSLALSLPPRSVLGGFEEGMSEAELEAVRWVAAHPEVIPPGSTIAADHRISSLLFGLAGLNATWDYTPRTYHAEDTRAVFDELRDARVPAMGRARVDHVFLSPEIEAGVTLEQWENSRPMTRAAIEKFDDATLFTKLYDVDGVRIWRLNWDAAGTTLS